MKEKVTEWTEWDVDSLAEKKRLPGPCLNNLCNWNEEGFKETNCKKLSSTLLITCGNYFPQLEKKKLARCENEDCKFWHPGKRLYCYKHTSADIHSCKEYYGNQEVPEGPANEVFKELPKKEDKYHKIAMEIAWIVQEKNDAYGSSVELSGEMLKIMYPNEIRPEQYSDVMIITRILDKLFRIATNKNAFEENPYQDIAGYAICKLGKGK